MGSYTPAGLTFPTTYEIYSDDPSEFVNIIYGITNNPHKTIFDGLAYLNKNSNLIYKGFVNNYRILDTYFMLYGPHINITGYIYLTNAGSPISSVEANFFKITYTDGNNIKMYTLKEGDCNKFPYDVNIKESINFKHVYIRISAIGSSQVLVFIDTDTSDRPYEQEDTTTNLYLGYIEQPSGEFGNVLVLQYILDSTPYRLYSDAIIKFGNNDSSNMRKFEIPKKYVSSNPVGIKTSISDSTFTNVGSLIKSDNSTTNELYIVSGQANMKETLSFYYELT